MSKSLDKLKARVVTLTEQLAKAAAAVESAAVIVNIEEGSTVSFKYGRGETAVVKVGLVLGSKVGENGVTILAIETGTGFDKGVVRIPAANVQSIVAAYPDSIESAPVQATA